MNEYISNYKLWESKIYEQSKKKATDAIARIVGATSNWGGGSNAGPLKKWNDEYPLKDQKIGDGYVITKAAGTPPVEGAWKTKKPASESERHYIKIGDKMITQTEDGEPQGMILTSKDIIDNPIEASGNGIYALARFMAMSNSGKARARGNWVFVLNKPDTDGIVHRVKMGDQHLASGLRGGGIYVMVAGDVLKPNAVGSKNDYTISATNRAKKEPDGVRILIQMAMPSLKGHYDDASTVLGKYHKRLMEDPDLWTNLLRGWKTYLHTYRGTAAKNPGESYEAMAAFNKRIIPLMIDAKANALKKVTGWIAEENGLEKDAFSNFYGLIDDWKASAGGGNWDTWTKNYAYKKVSMGGQSSTPSLEKDMYRTKFDNFVPTEYVKEDPSGKIPTERYNINDIKGLDDVEIFIDVDNYTDPKKTSVINKVKTSETPDKFVGKVEADGTLTGNIEQDDGELIQIKRNIKTKKPKKPFSQQHTTARQIPSGGNW
jgi:hypothetical protein